MAEKKQMVVIGAGLVGSLQAIYLKRRGYQVTCFEKRSDIRLDSSEAGRSINLIVTSRGLNALRKVDLEDEVLKITTPVVGRMMHSREGELVFQRYGKDDSECNYSVSRSQLNILMMNLAEREGVEIVFDHELSSIDFDSMTLKFENGKTVASERIFGTDGAGSKTRKELIRQVSSENKENYDEVEWLGASYKEMLMPAGKNGEYVIDKLALHIWPRATHMLMALPNLDGSFTMTLYLPERGEDSFETLKTKNDVQSLFERDFKDAIPLMPNYLEEFFDNPTGLLGTVRSAPWCYRDKCVLLGDSAHGVVPFYGQGMNSGFEDVFYFNQILEKLGEDWEQVFKKYYEKQKPNGDAIGDMAVENYLVMRDKVADPRYLLKRAIDHKLEIEFPKIYRPKYGMVTYTLIPYQLAQKAGVLQERILESLAADIKSIDELNLKEAKNLIEETFVPFIKENNISLERFR